MAMRPCAMGEAEGTRACAGGCECAATGDVSDITPTMPSAPILPKPPAFAFALAAASLPWGGLSLD